MDVIEDAKNKYIFNDIKQLIDINIYRFLLLLIKNIFLRPRSHLSISIDVLNLLNVQLKEINKQLFNNNENFKISLDYTKENLCNILKFVKMQNKIYAAEIIENILIIIFSFGFKIKKENTFGKYIYNNIEKLKSIKYENNEGLEDWLIPEKFKTITKKDIKKLLLNDIFISEKTMSDIQNENVLLNFLLELDREKNNYLKCKTKKKNLSYLNKEIIIFDFEDKKKNNNLEEANIDS